VIIDASALLAVVLAEPDAARYAKAIARAADPRIPSVTWFEASMQVDAGGDAIAVSRFDDFVQDFGLRIIPFTAEHARHARIGRRVYGRHNHPARLSFGDCLVYGVAKAERQPLLYKGAHLSSGDFSQTDIEPALKD
jgi:ribonuclease VapC